MPQKLRCSQMNCKEPSCCRRGCMKDLLHKHDQYFKKDFKCSNDDLDWFHSLYFYVILTFNKSRLVSIRQQFHQADMLKTFLKTQFLYRASSETERHESYKFLNMLKDLKRVVQKSGLIQHHWPLGLSKVKYIISLSNKKV